MEKVLWDVSSWAAFSSKMFANVLQNFLSLAHDCCETFANCFDPEPSLHNAHDRLLKPMKQAAQGPLRSA